MLKGFLKNINSILNKPYPYSNPSVYAVVVAAQKPRKSKFVLYKSYYRQKNVLKNVKKISIKLMFYTIKPCYTSFFGQGEKIV